MAPTGISPLARTLAAGGAALILGGAAIGVAAAQTATPSPAATATAAPATATATAAPATATPAWGSRPRRAPRRWPAADARWSPPGDGRARPGSAA